jgi:hypothetical protein
MMPRRQLQEKDFIQDSLNKNPFPMWLWLFLITVFAAISWGAHSYFSSMWLSDIQASPFLQVTNRQLSIFLWQFPEHMRINAKVKNGYLPGFQYENKISMVPADADKFVAAPPEVIFLYHTWHRQIGNDYIPRSISAEEFKEFLNYAEEWKPEFWPEAPKGYIQMVHQLSTVSVSGIPKDLNDLSDNILPVQVKQAFQGWKNFFKEGSEINLIRPSYEEVAAFVKAYPNYARNFWRNILNRSTPDYLISLSKKQGQEKVPNKELAPFLKVALYNYSKAQNMSQPPPKAL